MEKICTLVLNTCANLCESGFGIDFLVKVNKITAYSAEFVVVGLYASIQLINKRLNECIGLF